jgi:hypothetical protein
METKDETIYIGCQCHSPYHIIRVGLWEWRDQEPELLFELQADRHLGFFKRLKEAVRYVFGGENLGWHDVMPNHEDVLNLRRVIDSYTESYTVYKAKEEVKE